MSFTADHHGFYHEGVPFYPLVQDGLEPLIGGANGALVSLPAQLEHDLDWTEQAQMAERVVASGKFLLWEIDFGFSSLQIGPKDSARFYSFSLALEQFSKTLWPPFQKHTFGVVLYRGGFHPQSHFPSFLWEAATLDEELHSTQLFCEYFNRLVCFLPESVLPFILLDLPERISAARQSQLLSRGRLESLLLGLKGGKAPFSGLCWEAGYLQTSTPAASLIGICLPSDEYIDGPLLEKLDALMRFLKGKGWGFRLCGEERLTEEWDGLDKLIVFSSSLSPRGRRKLLGFIASGGIISTIGDPIGLPEEEFIVL